MWENYKIVKNMKLPKTEYRKSKANSKFLKKLKLLIATIFLLLLPAFLPLFNSFLPTQEEPERLSALQISGKTISPNNYDLTFKVTEDVKIPLKINKDNSTLGRVSSFIDKAVTVFGSTDTTLNAKVFNGKGKIIDSFDLDYNDLPEITLNPEKLVPGKYILRIFDPDNPNRFIEQDFTWGVLAINTNKSVYKEGETVKLVIAVLDDDGNMVCDALLRIKIQASEGQAYTLSTEDGNIQVSEWCTKKEYTLIPDYSATLSGVKSGVYEMQLTAETKNGVYTITDSFEVASTQEEGPLSPVTNRESINGHSGFNPESIQNISIDSRFRGNDSSESGNDNRQSFFDIERISATRIFPESAYPMMFDVTATEDFKGTVTETVPASFKISGLSLYELDEYFGHSDFEDDGVIVPLKITEKDDKKILEWQGDWKKGQIYHLHYKYQTPNISPEFYTVGPLKLINHKSEIVYQDIRSWSLAIDVATTMILLWDTGNGTIPAGWTCISCSGGAYENIYPRGASAYGSSTAGTAQHTHTQTHVSQTVAGDGSNFDAGSGETTAATGHTHTYSAGTVESKDNDPAYRTLNFIKSTGLPSTIPQNVIAIFDSATLPNSDWTAYSAIDSKFLKGGAATANAGSDTHTHTVSGSLLGNAGSYSLQGGDAELGPTLTHTHSCSGTNSSTDNKPPYYEVVFAYVNNASGTTLPSGLIAMFDDTAPTNWTRVSAWDGYFIRGNSSAYGANANTSTHTHTNLALSCPATSTSQSYDTAPSNGGSPLSHTHTDTVSFDTPSHLPVYRDTVFAKRDNIITISGYIRLADESTADTTESGTLMNITVEGGSTYTPAIDANGFYTQTFATPTSGNAILVFVNDGGDYEGSAVTVSDGADISLDLYEDRFIARSDKSATSIVLQDIVDVDSADADDLIPTVTTGGITIASGKELHIYTGDTFDPGGTVTTQTAGNLHLDDSSVMYLDTATNTIAGDITIDTSANLHIDTNTTVSGGDITATGTLSSSGGTVTMGATGTIGGGGSITFTDLTVSDTFTTTISSSITVSGGDMSSTGTSAYSYSGTPTVTINGTGNLGGGGTTSLYNLIIGDGDNSQTTTVASTLIINNDLNIYATETLAMGTNNDGLRNFDRLQPDHRKRHQYRLC
ncbi:MAG: hypothetical protein UT06_C0056G0003 [Candidatus Woesebacteria bacterium GW2011_GWA1_38_8]|uniref:Uncharacterized protein n=1 Tax=Candidatus Woesebacteria bacterium GW2011_GWA1_38_8 TaxID=1618547 RepID=A0A0G0KQ15_9BACT|nr:MAG: hypothetical protein UT06_C0056G0003 [Candidatus Woesebacteria bacterium GW2011_GWA1_38_8]